jgi:hypothetical protein
MLKIHIARNNGEEFFATFVMERNGRSMGFAPDCWRHVKFEQDKVAAMLHDLIPDMKNLFVADDDIVVSINNETDNGVLIALDKLPDGEYILTLRQRGYEDVLIAREKRKFFPIVERWANLCLELGCYGEFTVIHP